MAVTFNHLSWLSLRGKWQQSKGVTNSYSNHTQETGLWELDTLTYPISNRNNITSSSRKVNRYWSSREERKLDNEDDMVIVPNDGGWISGSDSDDSDWSVGWLEPHGPEFLSDNDDDESNNSFAVLVPCYGRGVHYATEIPQIKIFGTNGNFPDALLAESEKFMEKWLSSLHSN